VVTQTGCVQVFFQFWMPNWSRARCAALRFAVSLSPPISLSAFTSAAHCSVCACQASACAAAHRKDFRVGVHQLLSLLIGQVQIAGNRLEVLQRFGIQLNAFASLKLVFLRRAFLLLLFVTSGFFCYHQAYLPGLFS
jgi:hypothetical protein